MSYVMYTGVDGMELWESTVAHQFRPTEASKKRLDAIYDKISMEAKERSLQIKNYFTEHYGTEVEEILSIMMKGKPYRDIRPTMKLHGYFPDLEEDEEYMLQFSEGKFCVFKTVAGGYGGTTTVETNIHISRVQHLIDRYGK